MSNIDDALQYRWQQQNDSYAKTAMLRHVIAVILLLSAMTCLSIRAQIEAQSSVEQMYTIVVQWGMCVFVQAQIPINTFFTADFVDELERDALVPTGPEVLTFADLGVKPRKISMGIPIEHIRHLRAGGYDMGTTGDQASTGGAGYR